MKCHFIPWRWRTWLWSKIFQGWLCLENPSLAFSGKPSIISAEGATATFCAVAAGMSVALRAWREK
jgi:hypothetical protein